LHRRFPLEKGQPEDDVTVMLKPWVLMKNS